MFQTIFEKFSGFFDQRFIISVWIPSLFFWVALMSLVLGWAGASVILAWWNQHPTELQVALAVLLFAWITFFARLLLSVLASLVRIYEGYWKHFLLIERLPFLGNFRKRRQRYYARKIASLKTSKDEAAIYMRFPPVSRLDEVMPTRMGNILKNGEIHPQWLYGMNAVLVWPRLYSVLPEAYVRNFGSAAAEVELMLVISALGAAFACVGGLTAVLLLPYWVAPACIAGGVLVAWVGYEGAVRSALSYNSLVKAAFDLHRGTVLKTIGWSPATSYEKEKAQWESISQLWFQNPPPTRADALPLGYEPEKPAKAAEDSVGYLWLKSGGEEVRGRCIITTRPKGETVTEDGG
jgi:hypothetical protein